MNIIETERFRHRIRTRQKHGDIARPELTPKETADDRVGFHTQKGDARHVAPTGSLHQTTLEQPDPTTAAQALLKHVRIDVNVAGWHSGAHPPQCWTRALRPQSTLDTCDLIE